MRLEKRASVPPLALLLASVGAVAFTPVVSSLLVLWAGAPVGPTWGHVLRGGFGSVFAWTETLTRATPLILTGLAATIAFKARLFNIGAEGQLYAGALAAVAVGGLHGGEGFAAPDALLFAGMVLAAALAGALLLLGPALMKAKLGVDEVVTTLLLNFVVLLGVSALLDGAMKDPSAMGWPQSVALKAELELGRLVAGGWLSGDGGRPRVGRPRGSALEGQVTFEHLSPSGLDTWNQCGAKWWFTYMTDLPKAPPSVDMLVGSMTHRALEVVFGGDEPIGLDEAARVGWAEFSPLLPDDADPSDVKHRVWDSLTILYGWWWGEDVYACELEVRATVETPAGREAKFLGYADLVTRGATGALAVRDAKTGKPPSPGPWFREQLAKKLLQVQLYGVFIPAQEGLPVDSMHLDFTGNGRVETYSVRNANGVLAEFMEAWDDISHFV